MLVPYAAEQLGPVVVLGGSGFLGYHLLTAILEDTSFAASVSISSLDIQDSKSNAANPFIQHHTINISDRAALSRLLASIKPRLIFHLASPPPHASQDECHRTIIAGTQNVLSIAAEIPSVQALIYTSSTSIVNVSASPSNEELTEEQAILYASNAKNATPYQKRTAEAEKLVLNANTNSSHGLQTVALRLAPIYGPGEPHDGPVRTALEMLKQGKQKIQVGDDSAVFERVYVGNAVRACLLAAKALLYADQYAGGKVAGEAFFITDATPPLSFYTFARKVWAASGDHTDPAEIRHVGRKFVSSTAWLDEILSPLLTLGLRRSSSLRKRAAVLELDHGTRFCVGKARQRLGYGVERMISVDAGIRKVVEAQNRWVERKKSVSVGKVGLARKKSVLMK